MKNHSDFFSVEFCMKYSYTRAGPCQNGGELVNPTELASDAKCRCKEFYSGDFCDTISKVCIVTQFYVYNEKELLFGYDYPFTSVLFYCNIYSLV